MVLQVTQTEVGGLMVFFTVVSVVLLWYPKG